MQSSLPATMAFLLAINFAQVQSGVFAVENLDLVEGEKVLERGAQAQAGVENALRERMLVDGNNPTREGIARELDEMENMDLVTGEKVLESWKVSKNLTEGTDGTKRKGVKQKKGNLTRKERVPKREDADAKLWERLAKEKSKEKDGSQGEYKEEQIDANLWDKLVLEQAKSKRNKSSIVDKAIAKQKKDEEVDQKLVKEKSIEKEGEFKEEEINANLWDKLVLEQAKRNKSSIVDEAIARAKAAKEKKDHEQEVDRKLEEDVSVLTDTDWAAAINFLKMEQFSSRQGQYFHFLKLHPT